MAINGGQSALAEDAHPISPYHDVLRGEGYKYSGSEHGNSKSTGRERENHYTSPGKPDVSIRSHHTGFGEGKTNYFGPDKKKGSLIDIHKTAEPVVSASVHYPHPGREIEPGVHAKSISGGGVEGFKEHISNVKKTIS